VRHYNYWLGWEGTATAISINRQKHSTLPTWQLPILLLCASIQRSANADAEEKGAWLHQLRLSAWQAECWLCLVRHLSLSSALLAHPNPSKPV
jgi:hypothetical protein